MHQQSVTAIADIGDSVRERKQFLFCKLFLVALVRKEALSGNDLSDQLSIITAPLAAGKFHSAVFVHAVNSVVVSDPGAFTWFKTGYIFWE